MLLRYYQPIAAYRKEVATLAVCVLGFLAKNVSSSSTCIRANKTSQCSLISMHASTTDAGTTRFVPTTLFVLILRRFRQLHQQLQSKPHPSDIFKYRNNVMILKSDEKKKRNTPISSARL